VAARLGLYVVSDHSERCTIRSMISKEL
jgi:hypothetical protein